MTTPELLEFVRIEHALGMPLSEISRLLITEGEWDEEDVAEAFAALGLSTRPIETAKVEEVAPVVEAPVETTVAPEVAPAVEVAAPVEITTPAVEAVPATEVTPTAEVAPVAEEVVAPVAAPAFEPEHIESVEAVAKPKLPVVEDRVKMAEEIFGKGPVFEPFAVTDASEPVASAEEVARLKEENDRLKSEADARMKADAEAKALLEIKQKEEREAAAHAAEEAAKAAEAEAKQKADEEAARIAKEQEEKKAEEEKAAKEAEEAKKLEEEKAAVPIEPTEDEKAEEDIKAKIAADKAEAESEARAAAEAKARLEVEARMKAEEEARIKIEAEMKVRAEMAAKSAVAGLGVPVLGQAGVPGMMAPMAAPVIYATQVVAQGSAIAKPAEKLTPMRALTPSTPATKPAAPVAPAGPRPIKFDIAKLRTDAKAGAPAAGGANAAARTLSPEEFFRAQTAGEGIMGAAGADVARSLKVPHKRTMFGDLKRMEEGTLSAQVNGTSVTEEGAAAVSASGVVTPTEGVDPLSVGGTMAPVASTPEVVVPPKSGSPWLMLGVALGFLVVSVAVTAYYILVYRLPSSPEALLKEAIASTVSSGQQLHFNANFETDLEKQGGEHLVAHVTDSGDGLTDGHGFGASRHRLQLSIDDNGVNVPVSLHFSGESMNIADKYFLKADPSASVSDAFAKASGAWIETSLSEIGTVLGLQGQGKPVATLGGARLSDMVASSSPWRTTGAVERAGVAPVVIAPDQYSIPVALDAEKTIALVDTFGVLLRGADAEATSDVRREILRARYGAITGSVIVDRVSKRIVRIDLVGKYPKTSPDVSGELKFSLEITPSDKAVVDKAPAGAKTLDVIYGTTPGGSDQPGAPAPSAPSDVVPVIPPTASTTPVAAPATSTPVKAPKKQ